MSTTATVQLAPRFCGPADSGNGGYSAGTLATFVRAPVEVTLRRPPPLERALSVQAAADRAALLDGDDVVAEAVHADVDVELIDPVPFATAEAASRTSPFRDRAIHPFPTCFVCGPDRAEGDGMRLFAGRIGTTDHFAVPWTPAQVDVPIVWAALDCPSAAPMYLDADHPDPHVLGRIAARVDRLPVVGEPHVVMSWLRSRDGRKLHTASAIFDAAGNCCAAANATWIRLAPSAR